MVTLLPVPLVALVLLAVPLAAAARAVACPGADADTSRTPRLELDRSKVPEKHCRHVLDVRPWDECQGPNGSSLHLTHTPGKETEYECRDGYALDGVPFLHGVLDVVPSLRVVGCALPEGPIACLLRIYSPETIRTFSFWSQTSAGTIRAEHLDGLADVREVSLAENGLATLPADLFDGLPMLESLSLRDNKLCSVTPDVFRVPGPSLVRLDLNHNLLTLLPPDLFRNMSKLATLNLSSNQLTSLPDDIFSGMPLLRSIYLDGNRFQQLPETLFASNARLHVIYLRNNAGVNLLKLPSRFLAKLKELRKIFLRNSSLVHVPEDSFWGLRHLTEVDLSENQLKELPQSLFRDSENLEELNLSHNKIVVLENSTFQTCKNLKRINLANNEIFDLQQDAMVGLERLQSLKLERNLITYVGLLSSTPALKLLDLRNNRLSFCGGSDKQAESPFRMCALLTTVLLSNNNISAMCADWTRLKFLSKLDLRNNVIKTISWSPMSNETYAHLEIDLRNNSISGIDFFDPKNVAAKRAGYRKWLLEGNPWQCTCSQYFFLQLLQDKNTDLEEIFDVTGAFCKGPPSLAGLPLSRVPLPQLNCSFECVEPCSCHKQPAEATVVVNCTGKGLTTAPQRLPVLDGFEKISLFLGSNNLTSLPNFEGPGYSQVYKLSMSRNKLRDLTEFPESIKILELDENEITSIPSERLEIMTFSNVTLKLIHNPWECNCQLQPLVDFVQKHPHKVTHWNETKCTNDQILFHMKEKLCINTVWISISSALTVVCILAVVSALYYRFRFFIQAWLYEHDLFINCVSRKSPEDNLPFDVYISYSPQDEDFVRRDLLPGLVGPPYSLRVCLPVREFDGGRWIASETEKYIRCSRRTLVVVSSSFLSNVWGDLELRASHHQALTETVAKVVIVMLEDVGPHEDLDVELRAYLRMNTFVKWNQPFFWSHLRFLLPHRRSKTRRSASARDAASQKSEEALAERSGPWFVAPDVSP